MILLILASLLLGGCFPVLMVGAFATGPWMTQTPNAGCYVVDHEMAQRRPCKPEEVR